ncbi:uncharacterized protein isoform X21 [Macaca fascicularis]|uniref:uncharacterized protein isoform X21 n=1 Tax=Macaca fascicularis TaxID=9541 RepID=UPI003D158B5E
MADFLRNLLTFKYFRSKDCCSNGAHRERVCKFWSKQEWEADKSSSKSSSLHAPQSRYQELEVALDSSSATINQLNENVESLKQQKKQVEHQLEEEKKANYGNTQSTNRAVRGEWKVWSFLLSSQECFFPSLSVLAWLFSQRFNSRQSTSSCWKRQT